ncbi:aspartic proteinase precursor [Panus rudis PR-1116 ss-1]|nr:aspartic proteinase precursor [Panus rudis PR-1116 ss-1]
MIARLSLLLGLLATLSLEVLSKPIVVRDSPITLPVAKRVNATGIANVLKVDQARAKSLRTKGQRKNKGDLTPEKLASGASTGIPSTSYATEYVVNVTVGEPPVAYSLLVDTGSSNTWFGAKKLATQPPPSSVDTNQSLAIEYGSGVMLGEEWIDDLTMGSLTIKNQSLGVSLIAVGFDTVDGILGLGPMVLTYDTLFPNTTSYIPTVTDNAYYQGLIPEHKVGISFVPTTSMDGVNNGEITFGGIDESKMTGKLTTVPITSTYPSSLYVGINQTITYGSQNLPILDNVAGITDTGTTLLLIATDAFEAYQAATGAEVDPDIGLLRLTNEQFKNLESLFFHIGEDTFEFTANAQIWPRALNAAIGGTDDFVYLIVGDIGTPTGYGMDFIDGMSFLERFYSVYDTGNNEFAIATTQHTYAQIG